MNLLDYFSGADSAPQAQMVELRLRAEPAMILAFTTDSEDVSLHYVNDPAVRSYVLCPGSDCPVCHVGSPADRFALLPVYDAEERQVKVLRVAYSRRPGSLGLALIPHLTDSAIASKVLLISRDNWLYTVEARPLQDNADRGGSSIRAFLQARADGLKLASAFTCLPAEEIAAIPSIKRKLELVGTWTPPSGDA